jgi:Methyltransferase domain
MKATIPARRTLDRAERALVRVAPGIRRRFPARADAPFASRDETAGLTQADIFRAIFERNAWAGRESRSGEGSDFEYTAALRRELPRLVARFGIRSVLDAPCGDYNWMRDLRLDVERYVGVDVVPEVVAELGARYADATHSFVAADVSRDPLPTADLILCRDCLVHMSNDTARSTIANFKHTGSRFILTTTYLHRFWNARCGAPGGWRTLNLERPPFGFPRPLAVLDEEFAAHGGRYADKALGLWRLDSLP